MSSQQPQQQPAIASLATLLKAASDPLRLQILQVLGSNSFAASELSALLGLAQSRLSHHLKVLAQAEWVEAKREGNTLFYRRRLPNWHGSKEVAALQQAVFAAVNHAERQPAVEEALLKIEQQRSAQSQAYFAEQGDISNDPVLAYSDDYQDLAAKMLRRALPEKATSALEIGPGEGHFLTRIAPWFQHLVGIDRSTSMLDRAQEHFATHAMPPTELVQGNWPHNAPAQQFDAVILNMVLHHLAHPADSFIAAARRLKPKGVLLITELCEHQQHWTKEKCGHVWLGFAAEDLQRWAAEAGLVPQEVQFLALRNGFQIQVRSFVA
ncbi:MAG TPA: metalloregulator ArsR/SmtB family transcription factor [Alcanivoracaceae bacterium]|nr:metalloregulator ArsR/SmtB family transcription factor [Alcanivoracaceae bacterium]